MLESEDNGMNQLGLVNSTTSVAKRTFTAFRKYFIHIYPKHIMKKSKFHQFPSNIKKHQKACRNTTMTDYWWDHSKRNLISSNIEIRLAQIEQFHGRILFRTPSRFHPGQ